MITQLFLKYGSPFIFMFLTLLCCTEQNKLVHVLYLRQPKWHPQGKHVTLLKHESEQKIVGCDCGEGGGDVIITEPSQIYLYDTSGNTLKKLSPDSLRIIQYDWSPTGDNIAFLAYTRSYFMNFGLIDTFGVVRHIERLTDATAFCWSPDGLALAYYASLPNMTSANLVIENIISHQKQVLVDSSLLDILSFNFLNSDTMVLSGYLPTSRLFAYIFTLHINDMRLQLLDSIPDTHPKMIKWIPTKKAVCFSTTTYLDNQVFIRDTQSDTTIQITHFPTGDSFIYSLSVSPDGHFVAVSSISGIYVINLDSFSIQQATVSEKEFYWSPDSRRIVYTDTQAFYYYTVQ